MSQLNDTTTYRPLPGPPDGRIIMENLKSILQKYNRLYNHGTTTVMLNSAQFLLEPLLTENYKSGTFDILPKVHKTPLKGRPIVGSCKCLITNASILLDKLLQPVMQSLPTFIKNSNELITTLETSPTTHLLAADITSLYPSIDIQEVLHALRFTLTNAKFSNIELIMELTTWVPTNNYIIFNNLHYLQIKGVAMGTNVAVVFSCIYMSYIKQRTLQTCLLSPNFSNPTLNKRFIDDLILFFNNKYSAEHFVNTLNEQHQNIKATYEASDTSAVFLDVKIFNGKRFNSFSRLDFNTFQKPINVYQYLPLQSFHPTHVHKAWIVAELRRYLVRTSVHDDFIRIKAFFFFRLYHRRHNSEILNELFAPFNLYPYYINIIRNNLLEKIQKNQKINSDVSIPLIFKTTFNPSHQSTKLNRILSFKNSTLIFDKDYAKLSQGKDHPIICFKNNKSIQRLLIQSKFEY